MGGTHDGGPLPQCHCQNWGDFARAAPREGRRTLIVDLFMVGGWMRARSADRFGREKQRRHEFEL